MHTISSMQSKRVFYIYCIYIICNSLLKVCSSPSIRPALIRRFTSQAPPSPSPSQVTWSHHMTPVRFLRCAVAWVSPEDSITGRWTSATAPSTGSVREQQLSVVMFDALLMHIWRYFNKSNNKSSHVRKCRAGFSKRGLKRHRKRLEQIQKC